MNVRFWLILGAIGLAPSLLLADDFSSLEEMMTLDQFKQAGLEQLSPAQLNFLNRWLQDHGALPQAAAASATPSSDQQPVQAAPAAAPAESSSRIGFKETQEERGEVNSSIDGEFNGWGGKTRFKLANGQIWQQVGTGSFTHRAVNPKVTIKPKSFGSWKLYIDGINRGVKVKRVK